MGKTLYNKIISEIHNFTYIEAYNNHYITTESKYVILFHYIEIMILFLLVHVQTAASKPYDLTPEGS